MSLTRPIINQPIIPFDATKPYTFQFTSSGGDQVFGSDIIIYDNSTNAQVFLGTYTSFEFIHPINSNVLQNGKTYKIQLNTFNIDNVMSSNSDSVIFKCLSSPNISITNLSDNMIINNSSFEFTGSYTQAEGEVLQSYRFLLYDNNNVLLESSPEQFYNSTNNIIRYTFSGLNNDTYYGIQLITVTQNGIQTSTPILSFFIQYVAPLFGGALTLANFPDFGGIEITADVIEVNGTIGSGTISYQNGDLVDLSNGMIYFQKGIQPFDNFTLRIWVKNVVDKTPFIKILCPTGRIEVQSYDKRIHAFKYLNNCNLTAHFASNAVSTDISNQSLFVFIQQINNYINIQFEILGN